MYNQIIEEKDFKDYDHLCSAVYILFFLFAIKVSSSCLKKHLAMV